MGFILLGIVITLGMCGLCILLTHFEFYVLAFTIAFGSVIIFLNFIAEGISGEPKEYEKPELEGHAKKPIGIMANGKVYYLANVDECSYVYYEEVENGYKRVKLPKDQVEIKENDSYEEAVLEKYILRPKKTFWTFAVGGKKYKYVFYLPKASIAEVYIEEKNKN